MKHKNLTVNKLAFGNLKARRKQYTLMIIGILLAMIFSSGTLFFVSCFQSSREEQARRESGNFWGYFYQPKDYIDIEQGKKDGFIEQYGYGHIISYGYTDEEKQEKGTPIAWLDDDAKQLYYVTVLEGRYPENEDEIALEADAAIRLGIEPKAGKEITLSVLTADGEAYLPQANEKTYKLVGILEDKRAHIQNFNGMGPENAPMAAAFVSEKEPLGAGGKENIALYYNPTKEAIDESIKKTDEFGNTYSVSPLNEYFLSDVHEKLNPKETVSRSMTHVAEWYGSTIAIFDNVSVVAVLAIVLMLASCMGIINAFTTNLQERRRQIGLLRAVGTTKRQIINIFGREAFIITLICAPISVAISYFGVWLFAKLMGGSFIFLPDPFVLIVTTVVSVACVMLSALIPLIFAARVSPMQAIRNIDLSRKMKHKKIKQEKVFNAPKLLAKRSIKFYKAKQIGVSIILALTILLTCFGFSVLETEFLNSGWAVYNVGDYKVTRGTFPMSSNFVNMPNLTGGISSSEINEFAAFPLFGSMYGSKSYISFIETEEYSDYMELISLSWQGIRYNINHDDSLSGLLSEEKKDIQTLKKYWFAEGENEQYNALKSAAKTENELFRSEIKAFDKILFDKNIKRFQIVDGKIDIDKLNSGEEIILVAPKRIGFDFTLNKDGSLNRYGVNDVDNLPDDFYRDKREIFALTTLDYKAGDELKLKMLHSDSTSFSYTEEGKEEFGNVTVDEREVKIGAIVSPFSFGDYMSCRDELSIVTTTQGLDTIAGINLPYEELLIDSKSEVTEETDELANSFLNGVLSGTNFRYYSGFSQNREAQESLRTLLISLVSIVVLFFSICASIVNNSLTAKIRESKREIGTLRAVGASAREITQSYIRQLLSMFVWGCSTGFISYIVGHIGIIAYFKDPNYLTFEIWQAMLIIAVLFLICSINLYAKIKKEMKNSIVENIREL